MTKTHHIYILKDELGNPFYVGKTSIPEKRLKQHLTHVRRGSHYPVHNKLRKIISIKGNSDGIYEIIEADIPAESVDNREMFFIKLYKELGFNLKNLTDGGEGGKGFTPEINRRGALKRTGVPRSNVTKQRISDSKRGMRFTDKHRNSLKKAWEIRDPLSSEHYQKISEMNRGVVNTKQYIVMSPDGECYTTQRGLTDFCRSRGLSVGNLIHTKPDGNRKHHKGWRILSEKTS